MDDQQIELKLGGDSTYAPIPDKNVETALATLERIGRQDIAEQLKSGATVTVSLLRDTDVITGLYGVGTGLSLWKVIRGKWGCLYADEKLAPPIAKRDVAMSTAVAYAFDSDNAVVSIDGAPFKHMGWHYNAVGRYIREVVLPIEMQRSFSAYKLIREFRDLCNSAPELPDNTVIHVTPAKGESSYQMRNAKKLAVKLGIVASVEEAPQTFETTFGAVRELEEVYLLSQLESEQVSWTMAPSVDVEVLHSAATASEVQQLGLF